MLKKIKVCNTFFYAIPKINKFQLKSQVLRLFSVQNQNHFAIGHFYHSNTVHVYHSDPHCSCLNKINFFVFLINFFRIFFSDAPSMILHPRTVSGDRLSTVSLPCVVDSNPLPKYYWTRGSSREVGNQGYDEARLDCQV